MIKGLMAGLLWALDTVILSIGLNDYSLLWAAPLAATFLHDFFSSIWLTLLFLVQNRFKRAVSALKSKSARLVILAALLGGPIGMAGYVSAIYNMGASNTAVISSLYPALGIVMGHFIYKEKITPTQIAGVTLSLGAVIALSLSGSEGAKNLPLGLVCGVICTVGWASEGIIIQKGLKSKAIDNDYALWIRQITSALCFALIILPVTGGWNIVSDMNVSGNVWVFGTAAFFGSASYLCYYEAIHTIGAGKAMPLNSTYVAWALIFSFIFLAQVPSFTQILLGFCVILGAVLAAYKPQDKKQKPGTALRAKNQQDH